MAKSEIPEMEDSLEQKMIKLFEINTELKQKKKQYLDSIKDLRESKKGLEALITEEVMKLKKTVSVGAIRAEYVPQVQFRMRKETNNEQ